MAIPTVRDSPSFGGDAETMEKLTAARQPGQRMQTLDVAELSMYSRVRDSGRDWPTAWGSDEEEMSPEERETVNKASLADMVQNAMMEEPRASGKQALPDKTYGQSFQQHPNSSEQLQVTVERVLKSKQVQQAMRTHARKAAAEILESLLRSIATIEKDLSGRISHIEDRLAPGQDARRAAHHGQGGPYHGQPVPIHGQPGPIHGQPRPHHGQPGPHHGQPGAHRGELQLHASAHATLRSTTEPQRGPAPPGRLDPRAFNSDPQGTRPSSRQPQRPAQHLQPPQPQQQQQRPEQRGNNRSVSPSRQQAPAPEPAGPQLPPNRNMTIKDIEAYQIEMILRENSMRAARASNSASGSSPRSPSTAQSSHRGGGQQPAGPSGSGTRAAGSNGGGGANPNLASVLPGSVESGRPSGSRNASPGRRSSDTDDGADVMSMDSEESSGQNEGGQDSRRTKKKSISIRSFFSKRMGWDRSQTS